MRGLGAIVALLLIPAAAAGQKAGDLPVEQREPGSLIVISDDPCCEVLSRVPLSPGRDSAAIEGHRDRAFRAGPVLQLSLIGGRSLRIIDRRPAVPSEQYNCILEYYGNACRYHSFVDWWEEQGYYVVLVGLHEDSETYLISERDGRINVVVAPPVRSPSGRYAIAFDYNIMNGSRLELVELGTTPPRIFGVKAGPACQGLTDTDYLNHLRPKVRWLDDSHITFEGKGFFEKDDPNTKQLLRIVDGKAEWEC
jgi:hypothetical protein